jgi:uncharacterized protein (TIGR02145 family)
MAENLNCNLEGSKCYENSADSCAKYGRLYNWSTAMTACPVGYHLPSADEWTTLVDYAGGRDIGGKKLKSTSGWEDNNGTDEYGFAALPGGYGSSDGGFNDAGHIGLWWSSTSPLGYDSNAWRLRMGYDGETASRDANVKTSLESVRCVQD